MATSTIPGSTTDSTSTAAATSTPDAVSATDATVAPTTPPATMPSVGITPPALPIAIKVSFVLNTTDGLREISFGLEKDTDGITTDWTITFVLYERTDPDADFGAPVVSLNVFVASHLQDAAETMAHQGMTPAQSAHASGPGADAAKDVSTGAIPLPLGHRIIQGTLTAV